MNNNLLKMSLVISMTGLLFMQGNVRACDVKLAGTAFGTSPAWNNGNSTFDKATDGNSNTFFDYAQGSCGYTGIDLGNGIAQSVSKIRFFPRAGWESRMKCGKFQGSLTPSNSDYVDLYTISSTPACGKWTEATITNTGAFRYLRYVGPDNGFCNIAEVEFYTGVIPVSFEAENLCRTSSALGTQVSCGDAKNSNNAYVQFCGFPRIGDWIEFTLPSIKAGTYSVKLYYKANNNRGIGQGSIDGIDQGNVCDQYSAAVIYQDIFDMEEITLTSRSHKIRFEITGKNAASSDFTMTIDKIELIPVLAPIVTPLVDFDGNIYHTVKIGNQEWSVENLKTTHYNDGTPIPLVTDNTEWSLLSTGAYCWYDDVIANNEKYGALYNGFSVDTKKLAPAGWHVPTDEEWTVLENYLIANGYNWDGTTTGNKIAQAMAAQSDWNPWTGAGVPGDDYSKNNRSGFSALPGGSRSNDGFCGGRPLYGWWWSATGSGSSAWFRYLSACGAVLEKDFLDKRIGLSIRLVRD